MYLFGEHIKELRLDRDLPLRKVAAYLDIDTSILSKIERGERTANRDIVIRAAEFFNLDKEDFLMKYYSDEVAKILYQEEDYKNILIAAEEKIKYLKDKALIQGDIDFNNE